MGKKVRNERSHGTASSKWERGSVTHNTCCSLSLDRSRHHLTIPWVHTQRTVTDCLQGRIFWDSPGAFFCCVDQILLKTPSSQGQRGWWGSFLQLQIYVKSRLFFFGQILCPNSALKDINIARIANAVQVILWWRASAHWPSSGLTTICQRADPWPLPRPPPCSLPDQKLSAWLELWLLYEGRQESLGQKAGTQYLRVDKLQLFLSLFSYRLSPKPHQLGWAERAGHGHINGAIFAIFPAADGDVAWPGGGARQQVPLHLAWPKVCTCSRLEEYPWKLGGTTDQLAASISIDI